jgi:RNA polymerase sigma factor (TIGR02999 family)
MSGIESAESQLLRPSWNATMDRGYCHRIPFFLQPGLDQPVTKDVTTILSAASNGDPVAAEELAPLVYEQLRAMAAGLLRAERRGHTLQPTALVHEAFLKLIDQSRVQWNGRAHFLAVAATAMRRILVDHARSRRRSSRGGDGAGGASCGKHGWRRVPLDEVIESLEWRVAGLETLDEALERLEQLDPGQVRIVELRFFGGLTVEETAEVLGVSTRTVHREWRIAKAWLRGEVVKD